MKEKREKRENETEIKMNRCFFFWKMFEKKASNSGCRPRNPRRQSEPQGRATAIFRIAPSVRDTDQPTMLCGDAGTEKSVNNWPKEKIAQRRHWKAAQVTWTCHEREPQSQRPVRAVLGASPLPMNRATTQRVEPNHQGTFRVLNQDAQESSRCDIGSPTGGAFIETENWEALVAPEASDTS